MYSCPFCPLCCCSCIIGCICTIGAIICYCYITCNCCCCCCIIVTDTIIIIMYGVIIGRIVFAYCNTCLCCCCYCSPYCFPNCASCCLCVPWKPTAAQGKFISGGLDHCSGMTALCKPTTLPPIRFWHVVLRLWFEPGVLQVVLVWLSWTWFPQLQRMFFGPMCLELSHCFLDSCCHTLGLRQDIMDYLAYIDVLVLHLCLGQDLLCCSIQGVHIVRRFCI